MADYIDPSKIEEFKLLQLEGKRLASIGDLKASLQKFKLAKQICPTPKILLRIQKLKECLSNAYPEKDQTLPHLSSTSSFTEVKSEKSIVLKPTDASAARFEIRTNIKTEPKVLIDIQNIQSEKKSMERISESSDLSPQSRMKFKQLKNEAKQLAYAGEYDEAVNCFKRALSICACPSVNKYIKEVESLALANNQEAKELENPSNLKYQRASDSIRESSVNKPEQAKELEDHSIKKYQHASVSIRESVDNKPELFMQSDDTKDFKNQFTHQKHSSNSVADSIKLKSPLYNSENETDINRKLDKVKIIYEEARELAAVGKLADALKILKEAQSIHASQKVQKRIEKLEKLIGADLKDTEENEVIEISPGFSIYHEIYRKLYPYQREGVAWMWRLYKMGKGGVLGDDMGLGKTFQVIAFVSGMIDADLVKHILIIMPVSLLKNWEKEFKQWCPGIIVNDFHSGSKKERERNKLRVQRRGHVLLTSYGMIVNNVTQFTEMDGYDFVWDYVILDEAHKIKNPTKTTKAVYEIPAKNRLALTGTPIQNNLRELWSLYDFVHQGTLLGSLKTFKMQYENPISRAREKDATSGEKRLGSEMAENLKALIKPYFLRRTKSEIWTNKDDGIKDLETDMENMKITQVTAKKNDLILWAYMSEQQITIYTDFLHSDAVKSILVSKRSPLVELTTLKKICDHPRLLSQRACFHLGLNGDLQHNGELDLEDESTLASSIENVTDEELLKESGKLKLVLDLLENLKATGHRTLVFSLSRKILDMIHRILVNRNWKVMRLDGTIAKTADREKRIMKFQRDPSYPVFLLTTQVGGVGITLTAADRVIIYDPSWNPATDAQAVDRAYRIGQQKNVIVYRLITCGTVEEKIYRRQIFKDSITRQATGVADPFRYFSKQELRELFSLDDPLYSATQVQLHEMHSSQRATYDELEKHLEFLRHLNIFGISDHDLMFSKQIEDNSEDNDPNAISENFIKQQVAAAHAQIQMEASVVAEGIRLAGTYNRPYQETVPLVKKSIIKDPYKPPALPNIVDLTEDVQNKEFSSNSRKKSSFTSNNALENEIQNIFSESTNGSISEEEYHPSSIQKKPETVLPKLNKFSPAASPSKQFSEHSVMEISSDSENAVDYGVISDKFDTNFEDATVKNTEKLRKSSLIKPSADIDGCEFLENPSNDNDVKLDQTCALNANKLPIDDDEDVKQMASNPQPLDITCDLKKKFQANLTHFMNDDFGFNDEEPVVSVRKGRKSCARPSTQLISESDTSNPNSASNSIISSNFIDESEVNESDSDDSSNSASIPFVPDSASNTPSKYLKVQSIQPSVNYIPPGHFEPELLSRSAESSPINHNVRRQEGSVKRITPLKVYKSQMYGDSSFVQAMANSPLISPNDKHTHDQTNASNLASSDEEEEDSPLKVNKRKGVRQIYSDSDESDADSHNDTNNISDVEKVDQSYLKSFSDEEEELGHSKNADNEKQDEVSSNVMEERDHSDNEEQQDEEAERSHSEKTDNEEHLDEILSDEEKGHFESDDEEQRDEISSDKEEEQDLSKSFNEEQQRDGVFPNHSSTERSVSYHSSAEHSESYRSSAEHSTSYNSDSESKAESDLEQTFATCKDTRASNSGSDISSKDSEDYDDSDDESGSLFSDDN